MLPSIIGRLLFALALCATLCAVDWHQRSAAPLPARAVSVLALNPSNTASVPSVAAAQLRLIAQGRIPMPSDTLAAHASNLLAMPADSPSVLSVFWFAGDRESAPNVQIAASQFDRASQQWLPAKYVVNRQQLAAQLGFGVRRLGNPVAWVDANGRIHLFVVATGLGGWAAGRIVHLVQSSSSHALSELTFEPVRTLPLSWLMNTSYLVRSAPLPLEDGGMVLPAYFEIDIKYPVALRFDREGEFLGMQRMSVRSHVLQPTLLARSATDWLALLRDAGDNAEGHIQVVHSSDGGAHWQDESPLALTNPNAAIAALALGEKQMVLVHNSSPHSRAALDLSVSEDGRNWSLLHSIAHGSESDEYSYPALAWADNSLWVSYTDHRTHIAWQRFAVTPNAARATP